MKESDGERVNWCGNRVPGSCRGVVMVPTATQRCVPSTPYPVLGTSPFTVSRRSLMVQDGQDARARGPGGVIGIIHIRIKLDGDPTLVANGLDRPERGGEVDRAIARNQVLVHTRGRDVFEMNVTDVRRQPVNGRRRLVA